MLNDFSDDELIETTNALSNEKAIGWFQGRMEFGPRALGLDQLLLTQGLHAKI